MNYRFQEIRGMKIYFSLIRKAKYEAKGYSMIMFYFLSLNKPEFAQYAEDLSWHTTKADYYYLAWYLTMGYNTGSTNQEYQKLITFLRENCERNGWDFTEWLKTQSKV